MIRTRVFVIEQNISAEIETDKWENGSTHYLATEGEKPLQQRDRDCFDRWPIFLLTAPLI